MRRTDRERGTSFALNIFKICEFATLSTADAHGQPYGVPISPVLLNGKIYFHCAQDGHKLDNIAVNRLVCVSAVGSFRAVPKKFTMRYESAIAFGECAVVTDETEKRAALVAICEKFAPVGAKKIEEAIERDFDRTCVCRVTIERITGKSSEE